MAPNNFLLVCGRLQFLLVDHPFVLLCSSLVFVFVTFSQDKPLDDRPLL